MSTREWVVVGGDTTPAASAALRYAVREAARRPDGSVLVVHAFDVAGRADLALERDLDRSRRDSRYRAQSWVVEVLGDSDIDVPVTVRTPDGTVEDTLVDAARRARLVVVGEPQSDRRRDLASRLAQRVSCPVVTVGVGKEPALSR